MENVLPVALLVAAAMVFIVLEIITPSFGVLSILAIAALAGAVYFGFRIGPLAGWLTLGGIVVVIPLYCVALVRLAPRSRLGRGVFLPNADAGGLGEAGQEMASLVGREGEAISPLRPSGTVRIGGRRYSATTDGGFIEAGALVRVVRFDGMEIIVRHADAPGLGADPQPRSF